MTGDMLQFPRSLNAAFRRPHGRAPAIPESTTACSCPGPVSLERGETPRPDTPWAAEMDLLAQLVGSVMAHQTAELARLKKRIADLEGRERV